MTGVVCGGLAMPDWAGPGWVGLGRAVARGSGELGWVGVDLVARLCRSGLIVRSCVVILTSPSPVATNSLHAAAGTTARPECSAPGVAACRSMWLPGSMSDASGQAAQAGGRFVGIFGWKIHTSDTSYMVNRDVDLHEVSRVAVPVAPAGTTPAGMPAGPVWPPPTAPDTPRSRPAQCWRLSAGG